MKRNLILGGVGLGLIALMLFMIGRPNEQEQKEAAAQQAIVSDTTVPVTLTRPVIKTLQATLTLNGPIRTLGEVDLGSKLAGRIVMVGAGGSISSSIDGFTWSARTSGTTKNLNAVTYASDRRPFQRYVTDTTLMPKLDVTSPTPQTAMPEKTAPPAWAT